MKLVRRLFLLLILLGASTFGWKTIPPYLHHYQFESAVQSETLAARTTDRTDDQIRGLLYQRAMELGIPIKREQIEIHHRALEIKVGTLPPIPGRPAPAPSEPIRINQGLDIRVAYTVHIDMPFHPFDIDFVAGSRKPFKAEGTTTGNP